MKNSLYFLFSVPLTGFYFLFSIFCLPADEVTVKSVIKSSPTDSDKQTAVASKDKRIFLTKLSLCQIPTHKS